MADIFVSLDRIQPNPWQTRTRLDEAYIQELAADIKQRGLLQVPLGRLLDEQGRPLTASPTALGQMTAHSNRQVQLAFGHNRLAAYQLLNEHDPGNGWEMLPLRIAVLDDQAMALAAWSENAARKDLSPLEEAQALHKLISDFGWTQEQVGEHCGLARATVANKLRLLRLPEELQEKLHAGDLSERQGLALLPVYELPEAALARLEEKRADGNYYASRLDKVLKHPEKASSGDVREVVRGAIEAATVPLATDENNYSRPFFPVDREIAGVAAPTCQSCPHCLREKRCADPDCWAQKRAAWEQQEMAFALAATGLPLLTAAAAEQLKGYNAQTYFYPDNRAGLQRALERECAHLHLAYRPPRRDGVYGEYHALCVPDYPDAMYVCVHDGRNGNNCDCRDEDEEQRLAEKQEERAQHMAARQALREATIAELARDLQAQDLGAWRAVLYALQLIHYRGHSDAGKIKTADLGTICTQIAAQVVARVVRWEAPSIHGIEHDFAEWREKVGWVEKAGNPDETTVEE